MNETFSTAEAAKYLGLSRGSLYQHNHYMTGPAFDKVNGRLTFTKEALDTWRDLRKSGNKPKRSKRPKAN